jgi:hypothetical protein
VSKTEFEKYGRAAALAKKADRLGIHLRWLRDSWSADVEGRKCHGKTLEELTVFLKGFELGKDSTAKSLVPIKGDICGGWGCDDLNCSCHGEPIEDDEDDCDCGSDGCSESCDCECHEDDDPEDLDEDEGDDDDDIPF